MPSRKAKRSERTRDRWPDCCKSTTSSLILSAAMIAIFQEEGATNMSSVIGLHHVSLLVADTQGSLAFYQGILGLDIDPGRPDLGFPGAWLALGEAQIHLLELPNPDSIEGRPSHGGRDRHTAVSVTDLDGFAQRLERAGIPYTRSSSGRRALFCRDPDGNAWELVEPR